MIAQVLGDSLILQEKFESVEKGAGSHDRKKRQIVRWRKSGVELRPKRPFDKDHPWMPLPLQRYCLVHAVHEEVRHQLGGDAPPAQPHRRSFIGFYSGYRHAEQRCCGPF